MFQKRKASPALALPPFPAAATYTNWELSADRANAARRLMQQNGIRSDQITEVRGFADQRLRKPQTPSDPANRRVSLIVQYMEKKPAPARLAKKTRSGNWRRRKDRSRGKEKRVEATDLFHN